MTGVQSPDSKDFVGALLAPGAPFELRKEKRDGEEYSVFKHQFPTLRTHYNKAHEFGERPFLVYLDDRYTYSEVIEAAQNLACLLCFQFSLNKGDRVAICMRNCPEWMIAFIAITAAGGVVVPLNSWSTGQELIHCLEDSDCSLVIADDDRLARIRNEDGGSLPAVVVEGDRSESRSGDNVEPFWALIENTENSGWPPVEIAPTDNVLILYTSGTTGRPKGALFDHQRLIGGLMSIQFSMALVRAQIMADLEVAGIKMEMPSDYQPSTMLAFPLFHISGCLSQFLMNLTIGGKIAILHKWDPETALDLIVQEGITSFNGVATMISDLLESAKASGSDALLGVASIGGGGAAFPPRLVGDVKAMCPNAVMGTGYGQTEAGGTVASIVGREYEAHRGAVGRAMPFLDIRIVDSEGNTLPANERGHIIVRSAMTMKEYWRNPEETSKTIVKGWLHTGDVGYFDDDGFLYIADRIKDMVISAGENIYCAEIEQILHDHPDVREGAAFGLPDERLGESLAVVIVKEPGANPSADDIATHVGAHLAHFKIPKHVFIRSHPLKRNVSGKVVKKDLRAEIMRDAGIAEIA